MEGNVLRGILKTPCRRFKFSSVEYYIFDDPGKAFTDEQKRCLLDFATGLIRETFEKQDQGYFQSRKNYFEALAQFWLVVKEGEAIGFCGIRLFEYDSRKAIYVDTANVAKRYQSKGIATMIVALCWIVNSITSRKVLPLALRTQNPAVYRSFIDIAQPNILPEIDYVCEERIRPRIRGLALHTTKMLSAVKPVDYDEDLSVCRGAYGRNLYSEAFPFPNSDSISRYFNEYLDRKAGDTMLIVIWPRPTIYRVLRLFLITLKRASRARVERSSRRIPSTEIEQQSINT